VSVEAITWALGAEAPSSTAKFVLVALANCARAEDGRAWPSIAYLCEATQQDRKTVIANIARLEGAGLIREVGRMGSTKQIRMFELGQEIDNSTESGTVPRFPKKGAVFPVKGSQISPERVPKTGHGTVINRNGTVNEPEEPSALGAAASPAAPYRVPPCPNEELVRLYHEQLPSLPKVEVLSDSRKKSLSARWRDVCGDGKFDKADGLDWFVWFFKRVADSEFLMGRVAGKSGQFWRADFDFLVTPAKFIKVVEGRYLQGAK
jgi:hypothetical protein